MKHIFLLGFLIPALTVSAAERQIAALDDPAGDDHGNGELAYPLRNDFQAGDLDLLALRIVRIDDAYRFEARFRNPIRDPASVAGDSGPEPLSYFARRGFYAFNLDVYIDQDRVRGSGNTYTLPGRLASIDESHAWEKAIIVTPRPELMRRELIDAIVESEGARDSNKVAQRIDRSILFPTEIQVRKRIVSFVVPAAFLAGGRADTDWSMTAFVTGAKTSIEADFDLFRSSGNKLQDLTLGVMQPKPGRPRDTFGYSSIAAPGPIVDLLAPAPLDQQYLLSGAAALVGVNWAASGAAAAAGSDRPVTSLTHVPSPPPAAPEVTGTQRNGIAERLRTLNDLRTQGLVSEEEYQELRRKILSDL